MNGDWLGETNSPATMNDTSTGSGSALDWLGGLTSGASRILGSLKGQPTVDQLTNRANGTTTSGGSPWMIGAALIVGGLLIVALIFRR
jgi:hypothetical protein